MINPTQLLSPQSTNLSPAVLSKYYPVFDIGSTWTMFITSYISFDLQPSVVIAAKLRLGLHV